LRRFSWLVPSAFGCPRRPMRLSYALAGNRAWELPIPALSFAFANWHKLNDIQVLQLWKLSHAVRQCFICVQSERMKQFLSAHKRQKGAHPSGRAPQIR
jgi:hypothetical protein